MCKAKNYSEQLLEIFNNIKQDYNDLNNELSQADLKQQDILHKIENTNFNACDGYKLAKMIHDVRIKRREIKNELETLQLLKNNFIDKNLGLLNSTHQTVVKKDNILTNLTENKIYTPRAININKSFQSIPVSSLSQPIKEEYRLIHKSTGREIEIVSKIDNNLYLVKYKTKAGGRQILNKKNIINFDKVKLA